MQPRLIRLRDAPNYLGMDRHRFNEEVRPYLMVVPIGEIGIAFDRLDLDAWVDDYKQCKGRPPLKGRPQWEEKKCLGSLNVGTFGTLTRKSTDAEFQKVLEQALSKKPNVS
ncbi:uncharacterized protein RVIR1_06310 [Candidatus Rickettsiella viridis]|uniref:Uncharacterized protein n=1 Tax=Candidatus Rickettsiella viridis TaxID=676208 RepID=A0A2Z5UW54_9COXI|nr:hypothetical protein [Candidatus Rickettsiella viridis]BBB15130.1 uncharacterized protein RVIR1_06310 [Candidatus Rickettsiella viridis]